MGLGIVGLYPQGFPVVLLGSFRLAHVVQQDRQIVVHFCVLGSQPQRLREVVFRLAGVALCPP